MPTANGTRVLVNRLNRFPIHDSKGRTVFELKLVYNRDPQQVVDLFYVLPWFKGYDMLESVAYCLLQSSKEHSQGIRQEPYQSRTLNDCNEAKGVGADLKKNNIRQYSLHL